MGKIFKALEKAEKKSLNKPVRQSKAEPVVQQIKDSEKPTLDSRTVDNSKYHTQNKMLDRQQNSNDNTYNALPIDEVDTQLRGEHFLQKETNIHAVEQKQSPPQESFPVHNNKEKDENPISNNYVTSNSIQQFNVDVTADISKNISVKPVSPPKTLIKSISERQRQQNVEKEIGPSDAVLPKTSKEVSVRYSKTKVQIHDPEKLRKNKIFSIFDDMETTDEMKILRTQVLKKLKDIGGNSILVTSANPCEGKTFTSINLGVSIAKEFNRTVLIIDADIRKPTQNHTEFSTEFFSLKVEKGLTDYLDGTADISDILINPGIDRLTLIPGGATVNNSPELLNSGRMEEMMAEIKSRYPEDRLVIVDGPAVLPFPDALILSRYVDGVLPVIESEKTTSEDLKKMMSLLSEVNIFGFVLNKNRG